MNSKYDYDIIRPSTFRLTRLIQNGRHRLEAFKKLFQSLSISDHCVFVNIYVEAGTDLAKRAIEGLRQNQSTVAQTPDKWESRRVNAVNVSSFDLSRKSETSGERS